jgi:cytochrome c-type biogenesis protein CcmH
MAPRLRLLAWVAVLATSLSLLVVAAVDDGGLETDADRIQRLSDSYACPECRGQSVAESNAAVAATIRQFISDSVTAGATDREIRDQLVASYQARVLLNPPAEGFASLVWILPVVLVVIGAVGVGAAITGNRGSGRRASDEDRELVERAKHRAGAGS